MGDGTDHRHINRSMFIYDTGALFLWRQNLYSDDIMKDRALLIPVI